MHTIRETRLWTPAILIALLLATGCGGNDAKKGSPLSDCDYAGKFSAALGSFESDVRSVERAPDPKQALATLDSQLKALVAPLRTENLPKDLQKHNDGVIAAIASFRTQLSSVRAAAASGDKSKFTGELAKVEGNFSVQLAKVQAASAAVAARLDRCATK